MSAGFGSFAEVVPEAGVHIDPFARFEIPPRAKRADLTRFDLTRLDFWTSNATCNVEERSTGIYRKRTSTFK